MIDAYVIRIKTTDKDGTVTRMSDAAADELIKSSEEYKNEFKITKYDAVTPDRVDALMRLYDIKWNYPLEGGHLDLATGLYKSAYTNADPKKRIACFLSHYLLWKKVAKSKDPMLIFEHDAIFTTKLNLQLLYDSKFNIIALNDPRGATRKSWEYWEKSHKEVRNEINEVPYIDDNRIPQGLPGNSAYYITPEGGKRMLNLVWELGAWPNDALMCRQLLPNRLGCMKHPVTIVQGLPSTTTL